MSSKIDKEKVFDEEAFRKDFHRWCFDKPISDLTDLVREKIDLLARHAINDHRSRIIGRCPYCTDLRKTIDLLRHEISIW